eukprot:s62_g31.t1
MCVSCGVRPGVPAGHKFGCLNVGTKQVESVDKKDIFLSDLVGNVQRRPDISEISKPRGVFSVSHASEVAPPFHGVRCALGRPNGLGVLSTKSRWMASMNTEDLAWLKV